jgi:hypothetical protein
MTKGPLPLLATALVLAAMPASALAGSGDTAATRAYIQADYALVRTARANVPSSEAALQKLLRRVRAQCPGVAAGSPQEHDSEQLSNELVGAMTLAALAPDVHAVAAFTRAVGGLRWSDGALTRQVRGYVAGLKTLSALPAPDVCADVKAWVAGGYRALPASSVSFDSRYYPVDEVAVGELPAGLLAASESPSERPIVARARQLEQQLKEAEARAVETWGQLMEALKLNP